LNQTFKFTRTPETYYFKGGYVSFRKHKGILRYAIYFWDIEGVNIWSYEAGRVRDEAHLKQLLAIQDLGDVK